MGKNYALSVRFFGLVRPVRLGRTTNGLVRSESEVRGKSAFKVRTKSGPGRTAKWPVLLIPTQYTLGYDYLCFINYSRTQRKSLQKMKKYGWDDVNNNLLPHQKKGVKRKLPM